jgi:uncharacterized alkaline shock family protein YloU
VEQENGRRTQRGKVTIAPNVLVTIVQKTAISVPGVAKLCDSAPGVKRLLGALPRTSGAYPALRTTRTSGAYPSTSGAYPSTSGAYPSTSGAAGHGVKVQVVDDRIVADVYLVARREVELLPMGRQIQREVTRAIEDIVGMQVQEVNIHIEDIAPPPHPPEEARGYSGSLSATPLSATPLSATPTLYPTPGPPEKSAKADRPARQEQAG